jgi:lysophospholipase L1-like esterase
MRLLLLGDSPMREMDEAIKAINDECTTYLISVPSNLQSNTNQYRNNLQAITHFNPTNVIIHAGHNDIVFHHSSNRHPRNPRLVTHQIIQLINELSLNHPNIKPAISSIYPRTFTYRSYLAEEEVASYNQKAKRHGSHLKSTTRNTNITYLLNNCLWHRVSKAEENTDSFDNGGLHLTDVAKELVAREWLTIISQTNPPTEV